jgi:type II secretory pathway pseudopilin PulG
MEAMISAKNSRSRRSGGFALVEVMMGAVLIGLIAVGSVQALGAMNRNATGYRVMTNARAIVQRNIDNALSVTASTTSIPAILATTSAGGSAYDDDGGAEGVAVVLQGTAGTQLVQGTLTRIVTAVANADSADIRLVTFRLDYTLRGRAYTYQLSSLRAIDD